MKPEDRPIVRLRPTAQVARDLAAEGTQRAYAFLEVKAMDEDSRTIEGYATTPSTDRMGDIVESDGAEFKLPIPFLWQHSRSAPIGHVIEAKVTKAGIWMKAQLVKVAEEGALKQFVDRCWQEIKYGLVKGLSIGFAPIEHAQIDGTWGYRFIKWEWLELSAVTIPANSDCSIDRIKAIDTQARAALGQRRAAVVRLGDSTSPALGQPQPKPKGDDTMKTIQERIAEFKAERASTMAAIQAIIDKSLESGETLDAEQEQKHAELKAKVGTIDKHIKVLVEHEKLMVGGGEGGGNGTRTVQATNDPDDALANSKGASGGSSVEFRSGSQIRVAALEKGIAFARYAKCLAAAKGHTMAALEIAKAKYPDMQQLQTILKAAVAAGTTTDATWAGSLVEYNLFAGDFIEYLRPMTIIGKFGTMGIPALFQVPFNIEIPRQTSGGSGYWVGQGKPKPLTKFDFDRVQLAWAKIANIAVLTDELVRFSNPAADVLVRNALAQAIIEKADTDFLDPAVAAVANVSPASLTNGVTAITASGVDADAVRTDIAALMKSFIDANLSLLNGVWVMPAVVAMRLSLMRNALGQKEFPDITMLGGRLEGLPVITSQYVNNSVSGGSMVVLMDAQEVYLADDGQVTIDVSREASLQMDSAPTMDGTAGTGASVVSMFQINGIAMRAERYINWAKRRSAAVAYADNVHWGE